MKIANKNASQYVARRETFEGSHLYAVTKRAPCDPFRAAIREGLGQPLEVYAVFSYGEHFPLFAFVAGVWYENKDKYSVTTGKHRSQARPWGQSAFVQVDTETLKSICGV